jgi:hypothetical protein
MTLTMHCSLQHFDFKHPQRIFFSLSEKPSFTPAQNMYSNTLLEGYGLFLGSQMMMIMIIQFNSFIRVFANSKGPITGKH